MGIIGLLYGLFTVIIVIRELLYIIRVREFRIISGLRMMYALIYGFIPCSILLAYSFNGIITYGIDYSSTGVIKSAVLLGLSIVAYILIDFGYRIRFKHNTKTNRYKYEESITPEQNARMIWLIVLCTMIAVISLYLWTKAFGGPYEMAQYAASIRSGYTIKENGLAFFKHFANISTITAYLSFGLLINRSNNFSIRVFALFMFVINSYVKIMYSLIDDGRMTTAIFFIGFPVIYFYYGYLRGRLTLKKLIVRIAIMLFAGYLLIVFSEGFMNLLRYGEFTMEAKNFDLAASLRRELGYSFESGQKAVELRWNGYEYTFLKDCCSGIFAYFPTGLKPEIAKTSLTYINSINLYGTQVQYGSPPDFISTAIYDLGFIGVLLYPIFLGGIIRKLDTFFEFKKKQSVFNLILFICLLFRIARIIANASMYNVMLSVFYIVIVVLLANLLRKIRVGTKGERLWKEQKRSQWH